MAAIDLDRADEYVEVNARPSTLVSTRWRDGRAWRRRSDLRSATLAYNRLFARQQPSAADTQQEHEAIYAALEARSRNEPRGR